YLSLVRELYPDSSRVQESLTRFEQQRNQFITGLATQLQNRITDRDFSTPSPDFAQQVQALREVAPGHQLFVQHNLKNLLAKEAGLAVYLGERSKALVLLDQADTLFPQEAQRFQQIRNRLQRQDSSIQQPALAAVQANTRNQVERSEALTLLQQFDLEQNPESIADFLQALAKTDSSLY